MASEVRLPSWVAPAEWQQWIEWLMAGLHGRWRLPIVLLSVLFGQGRRTVTAWLRAQGIGADYEEYYYFLASLGRKTEPLAAMAA